ncbi:MAG: response regulator transcription factor [Bacteroidota bacterium]|jgi:two-component system alkaline phosphatase synthesis response regulator PhoP
MDNKIKPLVLIAEDEKSLSEVLKINLEIEGFNVIIADNGEKAISLYNENKNEIKLVLLDIMMPALSGLSVCSEIRSINPVVPIIILTAKGDSEDRILGLRIGADDYLVKPFNLEELILRINNLMKRKLNHEEIKNFEFAGNKLDFENWTFTNFSGEKGSLTKREINLLFLLITKKNTVVSRDEILQNVWEKHENPSSRTIDNMILSFRKYFEPDPKKPTFFHSVRGVGYRFSTL